MKQLFLNILLFVLGSSLIVGCSTNTQKENTGIGAVTGAVVGGLAGSAFGGGTGKVVAVAAGAIVGAIVGGEIGKHMDSTDNSQTSHALNNNKTHKTTYWKNKKTGVTYKVTPVSGPVSINGNDHCRKYRSTAIINGQTQTVYGTACRQADGSWQSVSA